MNNVTWSKREKEIARRAFDRACEREFASLIKQTCEMAQALEGPGDLWRLHDFLTDKRRDMGNKYDYRYSQLLFVFGRLMRDGWLQADDLEGLRQDKLARIERITTVDL
jgi:hypothetical protein